MEKTAGAVLLQVELQVSHPVSFWMSGIVLALGLAGVGVGVGLGLAAGGPGATAVLVVFCDWPPHPARKARQRRRGPEVTTPCTLFMGNSFPSGVSTVAQALKQCSPIFRVDAGSLVNAGSLKV
jgi:hypothetical protein